MENLDIALCGTSGLNAGMVCVCIENISFNLSSSTAVTHFELSSCVRYCCAFIRLFNHFIAVL